MSMILVQEIGRWRCETPRSEADGLRLAGLVTDEVRRHAVLEASMRAALCVLADRHRGRDARLDSFLDTVLSAGAEHPRVA